MSIPTAIVNEHHEALHAWLCRRDCFEESTVLLHVDRHADLKLPKTRVVVNDLPTSNDALLDLVRSEYSIDTFISVAAALGLYSGIFWLHREDGVDESAQLRFVGPGSDGCGLVSGHYGAGIAALTEAWVKTFSVQSSKNVLSFPKHRRYALDIDLDFFACNMRPVPRYTRLEITESAYRQHQCRASSWLTPLLGSFAKVVQEGERYFLTVCEYPAEIAQPLEPNLDVVRESLHAFCDQLATLADSPVFITIARSVFSGYTPGKWFSVIENELLERLSSLYNLSVHNHGEA